MLNKFFKKISVAVFTIVDTLEGWNSNIGNLQSDCGLFGKILGGPGKTGENSAISKSFTNFPPYYRMRIMLRILKGDSWDLNDNLNFFLDQNKITATTSEAFQNIFYGNQCGGKWREDEEFLIYDNTNDIRSKFSFTIKLIAETFNEDVNNESFGLQDVIILFFVCQPLCKTCSNFNSCTICINFATLKNGQCICNNGYYNLTYSCSNSICSECKVCSRECSSCYGASSSECSSCQSGSL